MLTSIAGAHLFVQGIGADVQSAGKSVVPPSVR